MKIDIATANGLTRGQESAVLIKIAEQTGIENIEEAVNAFLRGTVEVVMTKIIDFVGTTTTSATTEKFIAKDFFTTSNKEVKINNIDDQFTKWFLKGKGKIEDSIKEQELCYRDLRKRSVDGLIIEELGGKTKIETTLTELYNLLKRQSNGEESDLLTSGCSSIFFIKDAEGELRAVSVDWFDNGWWIYADPVGDSGDWPDGCRVFARNS